MRPIITIRRRVVLLWRLAILLLMSACMAAVSQNSAGVVAGSYLPMVQHQSQQPNLLVNGGFESGNLDGWTTGNGTTLSNTEAHSGAWSARIAYAGTAGAGTEADV